MGNLSVETIIKEMERIDEKYCETGLITEKEALFYNIHLDEVKRYYNDEGWNSRVKMESSRDKRFDGE